MNLCDFCYHKEVCEWRIYNDDNESCSNFSSEYDVEKCVKFFSEFMKIWNKKEYPEYLESDTEELLIKLGIIEGDEK